MSLAGFALPGECPRCCGDIETPFYDPSSPCDGRLVGGARCGYLALNGGSDPIPTEATGSNAPSPTSQNRRLNP